MTIEDVNAPSQAKELDEIRNLMSSDPASGCWTAEITEPRLLPSGAGFKIVFHPGRSFSDIAGNGWAAALCRENKAMPSSDWSLHLMACAATSRIPGEIRRIALITYDEQLSLAHRASDLAVEKLAKASIPLLFDELYCAYHECYELLNWKAHRSDHFKEGDSHLVYEPLPRYAARFTEDQLCSAIARHIAAMLAFTGTKPFAPSPTSMELASRTLSALSFGELSIPEELLSLDASAPLPSELLYLCAPGEQGSPSSELARLARMADELMEDWCTMLMSHGVNLMAGISGEHGIISDGAFAIASAIPSFRNAVREFCRKPNEDSEYELQSVCGMLNWERIDALAEQDEKTPQPPCPSEQLSRDMADFLVPAAAVKLDTERRRYDIQSCGLDHCASVLEHHLGDDGHAGSGRLPAFRGSAVWVRDGYNAVSLDLVDIYSFACAEYVLEEGAWAAMFVPLAVPPDLAPSAYAMALCATGKVPEGIRKVAVMCGDWEALPDDALDDISDEMRRSGIRVLSDPTGKICDDECTLGEQELFGLFEEAFIFHADDPVPLPSDVLSSKLALPAGFAQKISRAHRHLKAQHRLLSVAAGVCDLEANELPGRLRQLSCGMASDAALQAISRIPETRLSGMFPDQVMALGIPALFRPGDIRLESEEWEVAFDELRDLSCIWRDAVNSMDGLSAVSYFPLGYPMKVAVPIGKSLGVERAVEAYYKGVPIEDIMSDEGAGEYERIVL